MIEFKIRPDKNGKWRKKGGYFTVVVVRDTRAVRKMYGRGAGKGDDGVWAFVRANERGPDLGVIVFPKHLGVGVMTHEATHAALFFVSWQKNGQTYGKKNRFFSSAEQVCQAVGNISTEITLGLFRKGVWK